MVRKKSSRTPPAADGNAAAPTGGSPASRRGPRGDLDADRFVAAAVGLVEGGGVLSLRSVAAAAGATPTAMYTYFADMDDLLNAVGDAFVGRIPLAPLAVDGSVPDAPARLGRFVASAVEVLTASPGLADVLARRRIVGPHALALNEGLLRFLAAQGLEPARAAAATYALTTYVQAHALFEASATLTPGGERALAQVDPADFPLTAALETAAAPPLPGLDVLLDGILPARES